MASAPLPELIVRDAAAWRRWLGRNHAKAPGVGLVLAKSGAVSPTRLRYSDALEEALCYGWIDGQGQRRDETTYRVRFTPRRRRSQWSQRNCAIAEGLIREGRMQAAGMAEIERAKADGRWAAAYAGAAAIHVPPDLERALQAQATAKAMFARLTSQNRFAILYRIHGAKRPETRARRIQTFVAMLARGETIYAQRDPSPAEVASQVGEAKVLDGRRSGR